METIIVIALFVSLYLNFYLARELQKEYDKNKEICDGSIELSKEEAKHMIESLRESKKIFKEVDIKQGNIGKCTHKHMHQIDVCDMGNDEKESGKENENN